MAARALVSRGDTDAVLCLATIAPSAHWRDTLLFATAEIFATRPPLRGTLLNDLHAVDNMDKVSMEVLPSALLAIETANAPEHANGPEPAGSGSGAGRCRSGGNQELRQMTVTAVACGPLLPWVTV